MTPTLIGRWQTRLVLLATLGVAISAIFAIAYQSSLFFVVLVYVAFAGIAWDTLYITLQELRWESDSPAVFQVFNGLVEGVVIYGLIAALGLPGIAKGSVDPVVFAADYGLIWLAVFLWIQGPMRALFPLWRFHGGRIIPIVSNGRRG